MRKLCRFICFALLLLMLSGCANTEKYPWKLTEADTVYENVSEDVTVEIYQNNLASTGGYFILKNQGNSAAYFDGSFYLLVRKSGTWYQMDADTAVLTQYETKVNGGGRRGHIFHFDWEAVYGDLPNGTYRLVGSYRLKKQEPARPVFCTFKIGPATCKEDQFAIYDTSPAIYVNDRLYGTGGRGMKDLELESLTQIGVIERNVGGCNIPNENFHANHWEVGTPIYQWGDQIIVYDGETFWPYEADQYP